MIDASQWQRASELADELLSAQPSAAHWHRAAGQCALHLRRPERAHRHLQEALRLQPSDHLARYFLSHSLRLQGRSRDAERELHGAIDREPADSDYWIELGWLAFERRDFTSAERCALKARDLHPQCARAATLRVAAKSQLPRSRGGYRGDPQAQIAALRETLALDPQNDAALHNMGVVYFNELGEFAAAEHYFRQSLALQPDDALYRKHLARALRRQDPVLRALNAPWRAIRSIPRKLAEWRRRPMGLFLAILLAPAALFLAPFVLLFWLIFLWPPAIFYEHFALSDPAAHTTEAARHGERNKRSRWKLWNRLAGWQHWQRTTLLTLFLAASTCFWLVLATSLDALAYRPVLIGALAALAGAWLCICIFSAVSLLLAKRERRRRRQHLDLLEG